MKKVLVSFAFLLMASYASARSIYVVLAPCDNVPATIFDHEPTQEEIDEARKQMAKECDKLNNGEASGPIE